MPAEAIRPVFFQTDHQDWVYATHGGTVFLAEYQDRVYGVTCRHVFGDFEPSAIFVAQEKHAKKGSKPGRVTAFAYPSSPRGAAEGSDMTDLCLIEFGDDTSKGFFDRPYLIDDKTTASSALGHRLCVAGVLKSKSTIIPPDIRVGYCELEFGDAGPFSADLTLRHGVARFPSSRGARTRRRRRPT